MEKIYQIEGLSGPGQPQMESPELSIVIPALNEEKTIATCVQKALKTIQELGIKGEVIVADNGSSDGTGEIAAEAGARVITVFRKGYGSNLISGFRAARAPLMIMGDADNSYNFEEIAPFYQKLKDGYDLVMGNRFQGIIEKGANPFLHRYVGTPVLTWMLKLFFASKIGDVNCGMRGLAKSAFEKMHLRAAGMEFATEMVIKASLLGMKIIEVPCNLYRTEKDRNPHLKTWSDGWRHFRFMLLFTPTWTYLIPGIGLGLFGLLAMLFLTVRDVVEADWISFVTQKHIFSSMVLFLVGAQIVEFGLAAQAFSYSRRFDHANRTIGFIRNIRLEGGVLLGLLLILISASIFAYLFSSYYWDWFPRFTDALRNDMVAFAIAFVVLGIQVIYTAFLLSLFYLKVK